MKILSFTQAAGAVMCLALAGGAMPAAAAEPAVAATQDDYASLRAAMSRIRLIDYVIADTFQRRGSDLGPNDGYGKDRQRSEWRTAYDAAFERRMREKADALTDAILWTAATGFSHDDIVRLQALCAKPVVYRFQSALIEAMRQNKVAEFNGAALIRADADYQALSEADRNLFRRIIGVAVDWEKSPSAVSLYKAIEKDAEWDAFQAAPPAIAVPPVPTAAKASPIPAAPPPVRLDSGPPATESDYAPFRAVAVPIRMVDQLEAMAYASAMRDPHLSATQQIAVARAIHRRLDDKRGVIIDTVMRKAFGAFTHDEIARLSIICATPIVDRYSAATIEALRVGTDTDFNTFVASDPDGRSLSASDRTLLTKLSAETSHAMAGAIDTVWPIVEQALADVLLSNGPPRMPAGEADYGDFRSIARPARIVDMIVAFSDYMYGAGDKDHYYLRFSETYVATLRNAMERGIRAQGDTLTDAIMRKAVASFDRDEVMRLKALYANPAVLRYQAAIIDAIPNSESLADSVMAARNDTDFKALPQTDQDLLSRFNPALMKAFPAIKPAFAKILKRAQAEAEAADK